MPDWMPHDVHQTRYYLAKHFEELAQRYALRIPGWEVTNETMWGRGEGNWDRRSTIYHDPELVEWSFKTAEKYFPANELIINEWSGVWTDFLYNRSFYYMQIERAMQKGARIDAIGLQYHMFHRAEQEAEATKLYYKPSQLYRVMDTYALLGKPLQITEMTIPAYSNEPEDEALQAELLTNLYSIWFSHPAMEAAIYWNLVDGYAASAPLGDMTSGENYYYGGLVRFDLTPKPAYYALKKLFHETWHTSLELSTGEKKNSALFKGFYGTYDLTITAKEKTYQKSLHLQKPLMPEQIQTCTITL